MLKSARSRRLTAILLAIVFELSNVTLDARTKIKPGFNLFSQQQDVELGQESVKEAEKQLVLLNDPQTVNYVTQLGKKLAAKSMNPNYPWTFKVVNDPSINAFALPGGFIYVNRGAIEAADNEAQIAGVIGHEIGHVVARHGTNQMSKALLPQLGLSMLGGLTKGKGGWGALLAQYGVPLGLNLYFLKNSREHEAQADLLGTQEMADVGYDPSQLALFFQKLEGQGSSSTSGAASWFADHPSPENRVQSIDKEIKSLTVASNPVKDTPTFDQVKAHLRSLPPPPKKATPTGTTSQGTTGSSTAADWTSVAKPSGKFKAYSAPQNLYQVEYPAEWQVSTGEGSSATFVPEGGVQQVEQRDDIVIGIQVLLFEQEAPQGHAESLATRTDQFLGQLMQGNSYLHEVQGGREQIKVAGQPVLITRMEGQSPYRNAVEVVWAATQAYGDNQLFAVLCIAPQSRFKEFETTFRHVIESARLQL